MFWGVFSKDLVEAVRFSAWSIQMLKKLKCQNNSESMDIIELQNKVIYEYR